jgi:hypothetical protein
VPNLDVLCHLITFPELTMQERFHVMCMIFGAHTDQYDYHFVGFHPQFLATYLLGAGFDNLQAVKSFGIFDDTSNLCFKGFHISFNMIAKRGPQSGAIQTPAPNQPPAQ